MKRLALAVLLLFPAVILAQEQPIVRVEVEPDNVAVGETIRLRVTVLVPTFFPKPPTYPDFELASAITRLPANSSFPTSERVGGTSWAGITRDYQIYPLAGANYRIDGETIGVTWANPGSASYTADVPVPEIAFAGSVPAGAEGLDPYVAGRQLSISLNVSGNEGELEAGDAVVLEYTATLDGLPAIFLPPLAPVIEYEGASVYVDAPIVDDGPPATRVEKITIVFDAGGTIAVPPVSLDYWNTDSGRIETAATKAASFEVAGPPPADSLQPEQVMSMPDWQRIAAVLLVLALLIIAIRAVAPSIRTRASARAASRRASERYAFRQLESALTNGQASEAYAALLEWTSRLEPPMESRDFAAKYGDNKLPGSLEAFLRAHFRGGESVDLGLLGSQLALARSKLESTQAVNVHYALPPLNPGAFAD